MKSAQHFIAAALAAVLFTGTAAAGDPLRIEHPDKRTTEIPVEHPAAWLMLPIEEAAPEVPVEILAADEVLQRLHIRLAQFEVDYYMPLRVSDYPGADRIRVLNHHRNALAWSRIYTADRYDLPDERYRPAYHFAPAYGWMNDPNGMFYLDGVWHLFYQHNPYGAMWGNMHWGSATSRDLVTWEHHGDALCPDELGTIFSGSAVVDHDNTAGFGKGAVLAFYTSAGRYQQQSMAYSTDGGKSFTKYEGNPVVASQLGDCRDPKVFWYAPGKHWVMVLNERDGHSIYNSADLKNWEYKSHVTGFWECPELFELPVDGDKNHTKWVMYGASGTYMLGSFDGQTFTPEAGKYYYYTGSMYAAQTYSNIPASDGRRIQIGWGRISHDGMPFNGMMLLPNELTLRTTSKGVRLFSVPVRETEQLFQPVGNWTSLSSDAANQRLQAFSGKDCLRIRTTIKLSHATSAGLNLYGQSLVDYDMNSNLINGVFYSPDDRTSMELTADIYIDRTSIEVFIDGGAYSYSMKRSPREGNREGLHFWGNNIEVKNLEVFSVKSIW